MQALTTAAQLFCHPPYNLQYMNPCPTHQPPFTLKLEYRPLNHTISLPQRQYPLPFLPPPQPFHPPPLLDSSTTLNSSPYTLSLIIKHITQSINTVYPSPTLHIYEFYANGNFPMILHTTNGSQHKPYLPSTSPSPSTITHPSSSTTIHYNNIHTSKTSSTSTSTKPKPVTQDLYPPPSHSHMSTLTQLNTIPLKTTQLNLLFKSHRIPPISMLHKANTSSPYPSPV